MIGQAHVVDAAVRVVALRAVRRPARHHEQMCGLAPRRNAFVHVVVQHAVLRVRPVIREVALGVVAHHRAVTDERAQRVVHVFVRTRRLGRLGRRDEAVRRLSPCRRFFVRLRIAKWSRRPCIRRRSPSSRRFHTAGAARRGPAARPQACPDRPAHQRRRSLDDRLVRPAGFRQLPGVRLYRGQNGVLVLYGWLFDLAARPRPDAQVIGKTLPRLGRRSRRAQGRARVRRRHPGQFGGQSLARHPYLLRLRPHRPQGNLGHGLGRQEPAPDHALTTPIPSSPQFRPTARRSRLLATLGAILVYLCFRWIRSGIYGSITRALGEFVAVVHARRQTDRLLFVGGRRCCRIFIANLDGTGFRPISSLSAIDTEPKVNPKTGSDIVFSSGRSGPQQIYRMNMDGADVERLTGTGEAGNPSWHPDGQISPSPGRAVFPPGTSNIFVMDVASHKVLDAADAWRRQERKSELGARRTASGFQSTRGGQNADLFHAGGRNAGATVDDPGKQRQARLGKVMRFQEAMFMFSKRKINDRLDRALAGDVRGGLQEESAAASAAAASARRRRRPRPSRRSPRRPRSRSSAPSRPSIQRGQSVHPAVGGHWQCHQRLHRPGHRHGAEHRQPPCLPEQFDHL